MSDRRAFPRPTRRTNDFVKWVAEQQAAQRAAEQEAAQQQKVEAHQWN